MAYELPKTAYGKAVPVSEEESVEIPLLLDNGNNLLTDRGVQILVNMRGSSRYTNPNLHRRIDNEAPYVPGVHYSMVQYDKDGNPYKQKFTLGVWDGKKSYRTIETITHDEESETDEIP